MKGRFVKHDFYAAVELMPDSGDFNSPAGRVEIRLTALDPDTGKTILQPMVYPRVSFRDTLSSAQAKEWGEILACAAMIADSMLPALSWIPNDITMAAQQLWQTIPQEKGKQ